jgi:hypothetical protein
MAVGQFCAEKLMCEANSRTLAQISRAVDPLWLTADTELLQPAGPRCRNMAGNDESGRPEEFPAERTDDMSITLRALLAAGVLALTVLSNDAWAVCSTAVGCARAAPGPIAGAGLPLVAIGYGVYWFVKRRRKAAD